MTERERMPGATRSPGSDWTTTRYWESRDPGAGTRAPRAWTTSSARRLTLNGDWRFRLSRTAAGTGPGFADPDLDDAGWDAIRVPSHWVLEDITVLWADEPRLPAPRRDEHGPLYTNTAYPFPIDPPRMPEENPTGDYRLGFELPADWRTEGTVLRFQGIDSCGAVWLNGVPLGWSAGSRLVVEYDAGAALLPGWNVVAVRVHRWSAGSYLEDQDMWWLPGIFRDVELLERPAGAIDDLHVHASYDHRDGSGVLRVDADVPGRVLLPELGVDAATGAEVRLPAVEPWTAETPRLYRGTVSAGGEEIDLVVGFRTVAIVDGRLTVNGSPILFRGVNRHEFDAERGRTLDRTAMIRDIELMKRANVNAVRTSHYPPHPEFLRLCDEYGLWVVEECDLETHGFIYAGWEDNPPDDPAWAPALHDRMRRMVERDKNSPSVVVWSMANESWTGRTFAELRAWIDERDGTRPVLYERDPSYRDSDFFSLMYPSLDELEAIGRREEPTPDAVEPGSPDDVRRRALPFLLVEYAHAMGNGPGSLGDYQRILEGSERFCGGFVWEWMDGGIAARDADGRPIVLHGADIAYRPNGGRYCLDGLLFADRTPSPAYSELAAAIAPVAIEPDAARGTVRITNKHDHRDLGHLRWRWRVEAEGLLVAEGSLAVPRVPARSTAEVALPAEALANGGDLETWLTVTAELAADAAWAPAGHPISAGQALLGRPRRRAPEARDRSGERIGPLGEVLEAGADGRVGALLGIPLDPPRLDIWRAPVENDRGQGARNTLAASWKAVGLDRFLHRTDAVERGDDTLVVRGRSGPATQTLGILWTQTWCRDGDGVLLRLEVEFTGHWRDTPHGHHSVTPPRLGLRLGLPSAYRDAEWFGRGPAESYVDSLAAARVGRFASGIDALQTPYPVPQENGNHVGTRWLRVTGEGMPSLRIDGVEGLGGPWFDFTLRRWTSEALETARKPGELHDSGRVWLNLDLRQQGIGSASVGPALPERYRVPREPARFAVRFSTPAA